MTRARGVLAALTVLWTSAPLRAAEIAAAGEEADKFLGLPVALWKTINLALLLALLLSGAVTYVVSRKISTHVAAHPNTERYVAAAHTLQAGDVLKPEELVLVDWPTSITLSKPFTKIADLAGRAVIYPLAASQPILEDYLDAPGSGIGITTKIPEGMRATSVKSDGRRRIHVRLTSFARR